jgi:hypothetical protein
MSRQTHAEMLIQTLAELRDAECELETARLRRRCKAHAERFIKAYRPELDADGRSSEWMPRSNEAAREAARPSHDE